MSDTNDALPQAWVRQMHPRRGFPSAEAAAKNTSPKKAHKRLHDFYATIRDDVLLANRDEDKHATETVAWIDGALSQETPSDVGTVTQEAVALALFHMSSKGIAKTDSFADRWAQEGLPFATEVAMESFAIKASCEGAVPKTLDDQIEYAGVNRWEKYAEPMYLIRLRGLLAAAPDEVHAECVEVARRYLTDGISLERMIAIAYLFPDLKCVEALAAQAGQLTNKHDGRKALLLASIDQLEHLMTLQENVDLFGRFPSASYVPNILENFGANAPAALAYWLDATEVHGRNKKLTERLTLALALAHDGKGVPALVARIERKGAIAALEYALEDEPARAAEIEKAAEELPSKAQEILLPLMRRHKQASSSTKMETAPLDALPQVLKANATKRKAPKRIKDLAPLAHPAAMAWRAGEQKTFVGKPKLGGLTRSELEKVNDPYLMAWGPDDLSRACLRRFQPSSSWGFKDWLRPVVARYELDALDLVVACAEASIHDALPALMPFDAPRLAPLVAHGATRKKSEKRARSWLTRHPRSAAIALIPDALGGTGKAKKAALAAIEILAGKKRKVLIEVAGSYGEPAASALEQLLAAPPKEPTLPKFFEPRRLPKVLTKSRSHCLPESAVRRIAVVLATRKRGKKSRAVDDVRKACDAESLAELIWEAFEAFRDAGAPSKARWVMEGLGAFGTDATVARLEPLLRKWSEESNYQRALTGLEVLEELGSDRAARALLHASEDRRHRNLRVHGRLLLERIAKRRKVDVEELAELLVELPNLDEKLVLDFGPRRFHALIDVETWDWVVTDEDGKPRAKLPAAGKRDDANKADKATETFRRARTKLKTFVARERSLLEKAMCEERTWSASMFREHILLRRPRLRIASRLLWTTLGAQPTTFRITSDGTLADSSDEVWELAPSAKLALVHPVQLDAATLKTWVAVFADYELTQPFEQLQRRTSRMSDDEAKARELSRWAGKPTSAGALLSLQRRDWSHGDVEDGGEVYEMRKTMGKVVATLSFEPGIPLGDVAGAPEQVLGALRWTKGPLSPVALSELIRDLEPFN